ncbi:MAG TPA: HDIG domain-containing protein [Anaerohalosphaeraceae bacterium]|nr:HDIG domain-containing protein [Anaerohalosphaeraceae bacterium]
MGWFRKKISGRRQPAWANLPADRSRRWPEPMNGSRLLLIGLFFVYLAALVFLLSLDTEHPEFLTSGMRHFKPWPQIAALTVVTVLVLLGTVFYIHHCRPQFFNRANRAFTMAVLFWLLLAVNRFFSIWQGGVIYLATGTTITAAVILTMVFDQRFAIGMTVFYSVLACFSVSRLATLELFLTMMAGGLTCCGFLKEIRTRMKLIEVCAYASVAVFLMAYCFGMLQGKTHDQTLLNAGFAAGAAFLVGVFLQAFLPFIEKLFGIATSMTLMDYSDANQPLLKRLAMEAPGTFSHSLLIGSIAETAADAIGANGLLCRVGAYYHDIGKINKPSYFVENQMGSASRHEQLSPAMSKLVIAGHVNDGMEIAKEYGLPAVLRQFIETHHGTTLMEYFYNEARKKKGEHENEVSEIEFRYPGPKPRTREAAIVMLADAVESAARSLTDPSPTKIETLVHTIAMKRLQDGQFDDCDLTLRELSQIEASMSKFLAAHYHGRIAYPKLGDKSSGEDKPESAAAEKPQNGSNL